MLPLLFLVLASRATAELCPYVFDNQSYSRSSILTIRGLPTNLVHNPHTGDILFTLIDLESLQNDEVQTKMDQYILKNGEPIKIDNVNGQAAAVDVMRNRIYIASDDGLNVLNKTNKANFISLKDEDIVQIYKPQNAMDVLYVVIFPENEVFTVNLKRNEKKKVDHVPCAFILAVDADENVFYECDSKYVKVLLKGFQEPIEFVGIAKDTARAITVDGSDRVILAANDGLYHLRPDSLIPRKLMNLDFVPSGIAVHNEDIYLAGIGMIYKYSPAECK
ncbi:uncharacterized protein LOC128681136 [Plodia interpunctella]|uniref:uncharacterized protein LOC128681136 n=1 Tax=Plodia interpunctella TaxID=58824 RepID=UPI002368AFE1|nr:uncharacterized protein LOC128681136 [Plodia interpunctella]